MGKKSNCLIFIFSFFFYVSSMAATKIGKNFNHAIFVLFENENSENVISKPFFATLAAQGVNFTNFRAETHPSQGNYIALTSGGLNGVRGDRIQDLDVKNIVDLLEAGGLTWKVYAEDYPGNCFTGSKYEAYVRKHNPFISYLNIQKNPTRCSQIVNALEFDQDLKNNSLANYIFYIPNNLNNAHDTDVSYANNWFEKKFSKVIQNTKIMSDTILITTFDESQISNFGNNIYTTIVGANLKPQKIKGKFNHYSLLKLIEDNWNLGNLGKEDARSPSIPLIW